MHLPAPRVVIPATVEPITVADAKVHCRIDADITVWDAAIAAYISAARAHAEHVTQRTLAAQTLELVLDAFPAGAICLNASPVRSITSVTYVDADGNTQTIPPSAYVLDDVSEHACLLLSANSPSWPVTSGANSVRIRMQAGYATPADLFARWPDTRVWMLLHVANTYRNPDGGDGSHFTATTTYSRLLDSARIFA